MTEQQPRVRLASLRPARRNSDENLVAEESWDGEGVMLCVFESKAPGASLPAWIETHRNTLQQRLANTGAVLFRNFTVDSPEAFAAVTGSYGGEKLDYRERSSPRSLVTEHVYTSTEYPPDVPIFPHNENSYANVWPKKLFFCCLKPAEDGGATPIIDIRSVYRALDPEVRRRFEAHGILYGRNFSPQLGMSWQTAFQTTDQKIAEDYAASAGYEIEWLDPERLRTRRVGRASGTHPETGERIWFNHAAFFHVSTLPEKVRAPLLATVSEADLPNNTYYGDGSPIEPDVIEHVRSCYRRHQFTFGWRAGDVLILDNMLVAHAREAYSGQRRVLVSMLEPFHSESFV